MAAFGAFFFSPRKAAKTNGQLPDQKELNGIRSKEICTWHQRMKDEVTKRDLDFGKTHLYVLVHKLVSKKKTFREIINMD